MRVSSGGPAVVWIALTLAAAPSAYGGERVALLIGNSRYAHTTTLKNPQNDIVAMGKTLRGLGFEVTSRRDLDRRKLAEALYAFGQRAKGKDTAVVFYSGHGMEIDGRNYLLPVDAELRDPGRAKLEAVDVDSALSAVKGAGRLAVVILDACRNGPPGGTRSLGRGFVRMQTNWPGLVIAYSTAPGAVAWDGKGDLSPYTRALVERLARTPEIDVRRLLTSLRPTVSKYAGTSQRPFAEFGDMAEGRMSFTTTYAAADPGPAVAAAPPPKKTYGQAGPAKQRGVKPTSPAPPPPPPGCAPLNPKAGDITVTKNVVLCNPERPAATMTINAAARHYLSYTFTEDGAKETRCYPEETCVAPWGQVFRYKPSSDGQSGVVTAGW